RMGRPGWKRPRKLSPTALVWRTERLYTISVVGARRGTTQFLFPKLQPTSPTLFLPVPDLEIAPMKTSTERISHPRSTPSSVQAVTDALAAPFEPSEVKFKPAVVSGNRALALAYVDARVIQDRLDDVLGVAGWQDDYECRPDGAVVCRLRLRLGDEWITKGDVGGPREQPDQGDRRQAAVSDALQRAAGNVGIG